MTRVSVSDLSKIFDDGDEDVVAVDEVSFEVEDGEFIVLVGPSGCGKTTTLRMVGGLETPTEGTVSFDDTVVNEVKARNRDVAMVFQDFALYPHMSVSENLGFGLRRGNNDLTDEAIENRIAEVAGILEIDDLLDNRPSELSGGQKQRVALGRAIVREPRLFLFDEPLANLDANLRKTMRTEIDALQSQFGITSLYVTHNQEEAMTMADRIAVLNDGRLQQIGEPEEVFNNPANTFVAEFIGSPTINLFDADVEPTESGYHVTSTPVTFDVGDRSIRRNLEVQPATVGIRPQDLQPAETGTDHDLQIRGHVTLIEPLGTEAIVRVETDTGDLTATVSQYESLANGDELVLGVDVADVYLFDSDDELVKPRHYDAHAETQDEVTA